jgi:hypothetical protein
MASTESTKSSACASGLRVAAANTTGTKTSSQSSGLWRISFSKGLIGMCGSGEFSRGQAASEGRRLHTVARSSRRAKRRYAATVSRLITTPIVFQAITGRDPIRRP